MPTVEDILDLSASQGCTCIYTKEQLEAMTQEELEVIYKGIKALRKRT